MLSTQLPPRATTGGPHSVSNLPSYSPKPFPKPQPALPNARVVSKRPPANTPIKASNATSQKISTQPTPPSEPNPWKPVTVQRPSVPPRPSQPASSTYKVRQNAPESLAGRVAQQPKSNNPKNVIMSSLAFNAANSHEINKGLDRGDGCVVVCEGGKLFMSPVDAAKMGFQEGNRIPFDGKTVQIVVVTGEMATMLKEKQEATGRYLKLLGDIEQRNANIEQRNAAIQENKDRVSKKMEELIALVTKEKEDLPLGWEFTGLDQECYENVIGGMDDLIQSISEYKKGVNEYDGSDESKQVRLEKMRCEINAEFSKLSALLNLVKGRKEARKSV